mgnify:CR=1 FL=1
MSGYIGTAPVPQSTQTRETFTATAGQTTCNTGGYTAGYIDVFLNGVKLVSGTDYTATNGSDVVLLTGASAGDTLETVAYTAFTVADQTFTGNIVMADGLTVDNDGATVLTVDRATSDGTIIDVQKNGTTVGSIGASGGKVYISNDTGTGGLRFFNGGMNACDASGNEVDGLRDIGKVSSRFRNLYLSGGVYLGGTGSANKLDDYEEGNYTITTNVGSITANGGYYVKIGNMVYVTGVVGIFSDITSTSEILLSLPFTSEAGSGRNNHGSIMCRFVNVRVYS